MEVQFYENMDNLWMNDAVREDMQVLAEVFRQNAGISVGDALRRFTLNIRTRDMDLDNAWRDMIHAIASAKVFRIALAANINYKRPFDYLVNVCGLDKKTAASKSRKIRYAGYVYDSWAVILSNIARCPEIDRHTLSIWSLYDCRSYNHVLMMAAAHRTKSENNVGAAEQYYTGEQFQQLLMSTVTSEAFMAVRHDPKLVASLLSRISQASLAWCEQDE